MQHNGVLVLHKPSGYTSNACIQKIKRECGQKKIGHAGTLDPMVDGVLLVLLGQATKIAQCLVNDGTKIYKGILQLGYESTTWDREGELVAQYNTSSITKENVLKAMEEWRYIQKQEVPPISAIKFNGKELYKWKRMGYDVPRTFRDVRIDSVEILSIELPYATFRVKCGSGTYIRSLAHSLGKRLECGAVLHSLTREYSYPFYLHDAHNFEEVLSCGDNLAPFLSSIVESLPQYEHVLIGDEEAKKVYVGKTISAKGTFEEAKRAVLIHDKTALALAEFVSDTGEWKMIRGLF